MVTPLEIGVTKIFGIVWPFLLVLVIVGGIASSTIFKKNPGLGWLIGLILAILTIASPVMVKTINLMAPWYVLFFIFFIFIILAFMIFGIKEETIVDVLTNKTPGRWGSIFANWIIALSLIIFFGSLSHVLAVEKGFTPTTAPTFFKTLTHPLILGTAVILLVALFTVLKLSEKAQ